MSEENVEIVRRTLERVLASVERGDPAAYFDPAIIAADAEWVLTQPFEGRTVWTGPEEFVEFVRDWTEQFADWTFQVERVIDAEDGQVVALLHQSATGRESGVPVEWKLGQVHELEEGRLVRVTNYFSHAEALEAAGLSE